MAWRIIKQPNGLLARFSDIIDNFTHFDMNASKALNVCIECGCSMLAAKEKVAAGINDLIPWTNKLGSGIDRWEDAIKQVESVHGIKEVERIQKLFKQEGK